MPVRGWDLLANRAYARTYVDAVIMAMPWRSMQLQHTVQLAREVYFTPMNLTSRLGCEPPFCGRRVTQLCSGTRAMHTCQARDNRTQQRSAAFTTVTYCQWPHWSLLPHALPLARPVWVQTARQCRTA